MARWIVVGVEIFLQMTLGLGIFLQIYGGGRRRLRRTDWILIFFIIVFYGMTVQNYAGSLISTGAAITMSAVEAIWLAMWLGGHIKNALCWCFGYNCMIMLLEMPVLILCGLISSSTLREMNREPNFPGSFLKMLLLLFLCGGYWRWKQEINRFLADTMEKKAWIFFLFGLLGEFLTVYLMNLVWYHFSLWMLVMNLVLVLCVVFGVVIALVWTQYIVVERKNRMYLSREKILQSDYEFIRREQEKIRKINHDHRYDLTYLYDCFREGDCEKGRAYIEQKMAGVRRKKETEIWTGCGCVDFLIGSRMERARENDIEFFVDVTLMQLPIAEYELFTILGNLLDNAFEAAEKCSGNARYVKLKIHMINRMLTLEAENGYLEEPQVRNGKFISLKRGEGEHGWGIENVKEIVERNAGTMEVEYKDHIFCVYLMLGI